MVSALSCELKTCTPATARRFFGHFPTQTVRRDSLLVVGITPTGNRDCGKFAADATQLPTGCQPESLAKPARRRSHKATHLRAASSTAALARPRHSIVLSPISKSETIPRGGVVFSAAPAGARSPCASQAARAAGLGHPAPGGRRRIRRHAHPTA